MSEIQNMRVVSDYPSIKHFFAFNPVAIGTVENIDGIDYRVIDNTQTTIVSYIPVATQDNE